MVRRTRGGRNRPTQSRLPTQKQHPKAKARSNKRKNNRTEETLNKELEEYWGNEIGSKHLDQEMDDYWKDKPAN